MKRRLAAAAIAALVSMVAAGAHTGAATPAADPHVGHHADDKAASAYTDGEVRRIDKSAGKITLKHGPIANLDMPAMSMVFRAREPALLDQVKEGDKVRFKAEKLDGALTVTEIRPAY